MRRLPTRPELNLAARRLTRRAGLRLGLDVVPADFYSPILDPRGLSARYWDEAEPMPGLELDLDGQLEWIERELMVHVRELTLAVSPPEDPTQLHLDNPWYGPMDAQLLYAFLRHRPPARVLELGSGFSTLLVEHALERNAAQGGQWAEHHVVDPHPAPVLAPVRARLRLDAISAADAPEALFTTLAADDVLFVDTSHVVKPGGEVSRVVLELLPALAPGVLVHFHDIYRPFAYPRIFYERFNVHWQEQYVLQAFLAFNPNFAVVCADHALWRLRREQVRPLFAGLREGMEPSGFWFRRL